MSEQDRIFDAGRQYTLLGGFIFLFNLIMSTGVLALPLAFQQAGWIISSLAIIALCFTRSTMLMMSLINKTFQTGQMFEFFFGRLGNVLFYLNFCIYLVGDMAIYATGVPKSLRNVICHANSSLVILPGTDPCWPDHHLTRDDVYRINVAIFGACMLPFLFFNVTRSRWVQNVTIGTRWLAYLLMIALAIERAILIRRPTTSESVWQPAYYNHLNSSVANLTNPIPHPPAFNLAALPNFFGVCVYSFMCHHSIPGLVSPIRVKRNLFKRLFVPTYLFVLACNFLIAVTAIIAFVHINDFYTLNFVPDSETATAFHMPYWMALMIGYFLSLFPVFALSSVFPIIGTTLVGNLRVLFSLFQPFQTATAQRTLRFTLPFLVLLPPIAVALTTDNIGLLVGITGAIFGSGIQYLIPIVLVCKARLHLIKLVQAKSIEAQEGDEVKNEAPNDTSADLSGSTVALVASGDSSSSIWQQFKHSSVLLWKHSGCIDNLSPHQSPFKSLLWPLVIFSWGIFCIAISLVSKFSGH